MSETNDVNDAIKHFPRLRARTLRFGCGAPRSAQTVGDGSRALFLRSDGPEDLVTALWLSWFDESGEHHETKLADPRELLGATADSEDVPAEEKARRERAREGGTGIVGYSADDDGNRIVFTINGRLFLTDIDWNDETGAPEPHTRELAGEWLDEDPAMYTPVLNPRIAPDGEHVLYTTGSYLMLVDIGGELGDRITAVYGVSVEDEDGNPAENTWKIGLAEFVAGEEMDRYDGFWWAPDSQHVLFESFDTADEPTWYISDPADPEKPDAGRRYPRALTRNADVYLTVITLAFDENDRYAGITGNADVDWDREAYEYVAAVNWRRGHDPLVLVQNRRQTRDQVLEVAVEADGAALGATRVLEEHANEQWIDLVHGTPAYTPDGRLVCSLNDMATDTNRLTMDGRPFTPAGWNVRTVLAVTDEDVLAVVQRAPEIAPEVPDAWADAAATESVFGDHDARSFDVVSIDYNGTITPVTTDSGQWTASRGERGIVVSGRDMRSARAQMRHILGEQSATIASTAAEPGFTPNVTFTRLGEHQLYTAIIAPSPESPYAHAEKLPVLMKPYGGPGLPAGHRLAVLLLGGPVVGRPRLPGGHGRRPCTDRPRPGMGPRDLRGYEGRNAGRSGRGRQRPARGRRPAQRRCGITCGTAGCGRSGRRREPPTGASRHLPPAGGDSHAGPRQGVHDRLVVRRLPVRTGRAGRAERVQGRMRRRPAHRLDAVRHALHRALSGPRPGCLLPKRHRAGRTETRAPAYADPRFRRRQRHHRPQPAPLASPDGGGSPAHLPAVDGHHPYDQ